VFGLVLFVSAAGSVAMAQSSAMTQQQYLQWMANICGERLSASGTGQELINWAREKGMNPAGGWQLNAKLSKDVVAQTLVQLLNLAPRKGNFDAVRILEREGILISSTDGYVSQKSFVTLVDTGLPSRISPTANLRGGPPSETRPGNGKGDKNHEHTGAPGQIKKAADGNAGNSHIGQRR